MADFPHMECKLVLMLMMRVLQMHKARKRFSFGITYAQCAYEPTLNLLVIVNA